MDAYDLDFAEEGEPSDKLAMAQHAFELNRETLRFVCAKCGQKMSDGTPYCPGARKAL
jgi:hypothetical protein